MLQSGPCCALLQACVLVSRLSGESSLTEAILAVQAMGSGFSGFVSFLRQIGQEQSQMRKNVYGPAAVQLKLAASAATNGRQKQSTCSKLA